MRVRSKSDTGDLASAHALAPRRGGDDWLAPGKQHFSAERHDVLAAGQVPQMLDVAQARIIGHHTAERQHPNRGLRPALQIRCHTQRHLRPAAIAEQRERRAPSVPMAQQRPLQFHGDAILVDRAVPGL